MSGFLQNNVVIGHNRHATKGSSTDPAGAHPFQHGKITLVHNGSLTHHASLTTETFTVDSEAICKAIDTDGIEVVGPKLVGDFALVWINSEDQTLNFLRNENRPFAIAWNSNTNKMYWASEMDMLKWSINRDTFTRTAVRTTDIFELEVGKWLSVPISRMGIDLAAATYTDIDVSNSTWHYPYNNYSARGARGTNTANTQITTTVYDKKLTLQEESVFDEPAEITTLYSYGPSRELALGLVAAKSAETAGKAKIGIRSFVYTVDSNPACSGLDDRIPVLLEKFIPHTPGVDNAYGRVIGRMAEWPYCEVNIYGWNKTGFDSLIKHTGVISAYLSGIVEGTLPTPIPSSLTDECLQTFVLTCRKDSIRAFKLGEAMWDYDKIDLDALCPSALVEVNAAQAIYEDIIKTPETKGLRVKLVDGSEVNVGGTAVFLGTSTYLLTNGRYHVTRIHLDGTKGTCSITCKLGDREYVFPSCDWIKGSLKILGSEDAESGEVVTNHTGEYIAVGKLLEATSHGCDSCGEKPRTAENLRNITWYTARVFHCQGCDFDLRNIGY